MEAPKEPEYQYKKLTKVSLACPECGAVIGHDEININKTLVKCNSCGTVSQIEEDDFFRKRHSNKPTKLMPPGTELLHLPNSLDVRINWFKASSKMELIFKSVFALVWAGILIPFVLSALASGTVMSFLPISLHLLVGVGMLYWATADFLNNTDVIIDEDLLYVDYGPIKLPFKYALEIPTNEITQLYVSRYTNSEVNGKPIYKYALYVIKKDGDKVKIIDGMDIATQRYLEQEIELYLKIEDRPVADEWIH